MHTTYQNTIIKIDILTSTGLILSYTQIMYTNTQTYE